MRRTWVPVLGVLLVAIVGFFARHALDAFDRPIFDAELGSTSHLAPPWPDDLLFVAIDDAAISRYSSDGQWPVHRTEVARLADRLHELGARTIFYDGAITTRTDPEIDARVAKSIAGAILPIGFTKSGGSDPAILRAATLEGNFPGVPRIDPRRLLTPIEPFASAAGGLGHAVANFDSDGFQRTVEPVLVVGTSGRALPSVVLVALARQRGLDLTKMRASGDELVIPGLPPVALDHGRLHLELSPRIEAARPRVTMIDVVEPKDSEALRARVAGKLVFVYMENKSDSGPSPLGRETWGGQVLGEALRLIASGHSSRRIAPDRIIGVLGLLLAFATLPLVKRAPRSIAGGTLAAMLFYVILQTQLAHRRDLLLPVLVPELILLASGLILAVYATWSAADRADWHRAPTGTVAMVFTDVQGSTSLWERDRSAMQRSLALHNACFRALLADLGGYEVKTEGDAFMVAFPDVVSAATWCLTVQATLLALDWPAGILALSDAAEVAAPNGDLIFRGLRVRMGIHVGEPDPHVDPLTGRMDYFGPVVNKAARVSGSAVGGQVVVSGEVWKLLAGKRGLLPPIEVRDLGMRALKGISVETQLVEIMPSALAPRIAALS